MNASRKNPYSPRWSSFVAASAFALALAGCGGGGGGSSSDSTSTAPPPVAPPVVTAPSGAPAGSAVVTAAAADPVTSNTAANPNQAFGLIVAAGGTPITLNSPPVVYFTVIDSAGKFVPGLTLVKETGKADAACSTSATSTAGNVTFAMAKLDGATGYWQSLISRQRLDASVTTPITRYSVVEGTTDPKPTATLTNPTTAVSDPSTRVVGILEENASGGYYTYRFATDVVTPLLLKDAVAGRSFAATAASATAPAYQNRIANNGNVAVKDGNTIHRVGVQLCYTDPVSSAKVVVNPTMDFKVCADGVGVPVKASDGKTVAPYRKVVDAASCNECHSKLTAHGTRVDPNYCVICHNPGSGDYYNNTNVDLRTMAHRIHAGGKLKGWFGTTYKVASLDFSKVNFPQPLGNCTKCHDGAKKDAAGAQLAAQGDNWKNAPTRVACGSCHAGINFATNTGVTIGDAAKGLTTSSVAHIGGAKQDDTQCILCHDSTNIPVYHSDTIPTTADASKRTMSAEITGVTIDVVPTAVTATTTAGSTGTGNVTVTFTLTDNGVPVTTSTAFSGMAFTLNKLNFAANGSSTYWQSYTGRGRTKDATKPPVIQGYSENALAANLTHAGSGVWTYKFQLLNGSTPGDIRTISKVANATAGSITGVYSAASMPVLPNATLTDTSMTTVSYDWWKTHRVGMEFNKVSGTTRIDNKFNAIFDFVPLADPARKAETRNIVSMNTCATCHAGTKLHKGYTVEYCVACHNQNTYEPYSGSTTTLLGTVSVDLQQFVHKLHMGRDLPSVAAGGSYIINNENYSYGAFPGNIKDCAICHSATATKPGSTTVLENASAWYTTPTKRACGTCHDSAAALSHIDGQIFAGAEQCTTCHSATSAYGLDVKSVHRK